MIDRILEKINKISNKNYSDKNGFILSSSYMTGHNIVLTILGASKEDSFVVKIPRYTESAKFIRIEYNNLLYLNKILPVEIRDSIPQPIIFDNILGNQILVESFISGKSLIEFMAISKSSSLKNKIEIQYQKAFKWLTNFHLNTITSNKIFDENLFNKEVLEPINFFRDSYNVDTNENQFFVEIENKCSGLIGEPINLIFRHGDFWIGNIINHFEKLYVIDWENGLQESLPFHDIWLFISTASQYINKGFLAQGGMNNHFNYTFFEKHWYSDFLQKLIFEYMQVTKINSEWLKLFFPLFLIEMATREFQKYGLHKEGDLNWRKHLIYLIKRKESSEFWINKL